MHGFENVENWLKLLFRLLLNVRCTMCKSLMYYYIMVISGYKVASQTFD